MSAIFTHDVGQRRWQMCLCADCGCAGVHGAGQSFEPLDEGGPLLCPDCWTSAMWDRAIDLDPAYLTMWHDGGALPVTKCGRVYAFTPIDSHEIQARMRGDS